MDSEHPRNDEQDAAYEPPQLVVLGSVEELTHTTLDIFSDEPNGQRPLIPN